LLKVNLSSGGFMERPKNVVLAIRLFIIYIILGIFSTFLTLSKMPNENFWPAFYLAVFGYAITAFLLFKASKRKNWSRFIMLSLSLLGFIDFFSQYKQIFLEPSLLSIVYTLCALLNICALVLLFTKSSNAWFRYKNLATAAPPESEPSPS
jgi:hypothetical protein